MKKQKYELDEAQEKLELYCAKQERSHQQIQQKLYDWGIYGDAAEEIITHLIQENYLNESRFAEAYVQGKFRMNRWGKMKIQQGLKHHGVSSYNITNSMKIIDEEEYLDCLEKLARQKMRSLSNELNAFEKKDKLTRYLAQKGYSYADIRTVFENAGIQRELDKNE